MHLEKFRSRGNFVRLKEFRLILYKKKNYSEAYQVGVIQNEGGSTYY